MKTLSLNKDSWHYEIARITGNVYDTDVCGYSRKVFGGFVAIAAIIAAVSFFGFLIIEMVLSIAFSLYYGMDLFSEAGGFTTMLMLALMVFGAVHIFFGWLGERKMRKQNEAWNRYCNGELETAKIPDGFVKTLYKSYKEKYCVRIEFE